MKPFSTYFDDIPTWNYSDFLNCLYPLVLLFQPTFSGFWSWLSYYSCICTLFFVWLCMLLQKNPNELSSQFFSFTNHLYMWNLPPSLILPFSNSLTLLSLRLYSLTRIFHKYFKQISKIILILLILQTVLSHVFLSVRRNINTLPFYSFSLST